jgi:hypothetical protein
MPVSVEILLFSGGPGPTFDLDDGEATHLVSEVKATMAGAPLAESPQPVLGYRGFALVPPAEPGFPTFLTIGQGAIVGQTDDSETAWPDTRGCEQWLKDRADAAGLGDPVNPERGDPAPPEAIRPAGRRLGLADEMLASGLDFARSILAQLEAASLGDVPSFAAAAGVPLFADLDEVVAAKLDIARTRIGMVAPAMMAGDLATAAGHIGVLLSAINTAALKVGGKPLRDIVLGSVNWAGLAPAGLVKQLGLPSGKPDRLYVDGGAVVFELDANAVQLAPAPALFGFDRATLGARLRADGASPVFALSLQLTGAEVGIGGGPVSDLLGGKGGSARADFGLGVDSTRGLTLSAGASSRIVVSAHTVSGPFELREITVELPEGRPNTFVIGTTVLLNLGPIQATVEGAGVTLDIDANGVSSGASPLAIGLNAPNGIGISLDTGIVRGGGFLEERSGGYGGALQLRVGPVEVDAFGLLTLKPDFALVVVMSARFTPALDLTFGFTLNAVGGLVGIEHRLDGDALTAQVSSGALEHILFPPDPVAAAPTILDTLDQVFPASQGSFVIGPMIEIGWGRPVSFITVQIGIILSLPDPKLAIIGRGRIALPAPELPIVDLRATVVGEIDSERFYMRASLVGSRIATFPVNGDVGVVMRWSGGAEFALSAGGFHPQYSPPRELCDMQRLGMDLSPPAILRMRGESYFALTSNSIQLGSRIEMSADLDVASIDGVFAFDAIVVYSPHFRFLIDLGIAITVRALGETIGGVQVQLHLEGPAAWRAEGHATVEIFGFDVSVDVGPFTWGDANNPPPAPAEPRQLVFDALNQNPGAWQAFAPPDADRVVSLAAAEPSDTEVTVHPLGLFEVRQRAVPLETVLARVGPSPVPPGQQRVYIGPPRVGAVLAGAISEVTDLFAPGEFLDLTDDQKLSRPGFEPMPAGARVRPPGETVNVGAARHAELRYETFVCDDDSMRGKRSIGLRDTFFAASAAKALKAGAAGASALRARDRYVTAPDPITFADAGAVAVVSKSTVAVVPGTVTQTYTHAAEETLTADQQLARIGVAA